jgi:hypothetical protein
MGRLIIFRCPITALEVQTLRPALERDGEEGKSYESLTCPSCTRLHFLNHETGKLLGYEKE